MKQIVSLTSSGALFSLTKLSQSGETPGSTFEETIYFTTLSLKLYSEAFNMGSLSWELLTLLCTPTTTTVTMWTIQGNSRSAWKGEVAC